MGLLAIGDKIVVGSGEYLNIYEYRAGDVVGPRIVTAPTRPSEGGGWYLPAEEYWGTIT